MFENIRESVYFIGIGGISMSALALILKSKGHVVGGSDEVESSLTKKLQNYDINVYFPSNVSKIDNYDAVVFTAAISENNEELKEARRLNKQIYSRAELLGLISKNYKSTIAISGTHGKTTTTAMISAIMIDSNKKPSVHIGGEFDKINGNVYLGSSDIFITEACEYKDSFLKLNPSVSVILNIQPDHLDYFKNFDNELESFKKFAKNTKQGTLVINRDDENYKSIIDNSECKIVSYSVNYDADYSARNININREGCYYFDCYEKNRFLGKIYLSVRGKHNIYNALAAISVCRQFKVSYYQILKSLKSFYGVERRFEEVGNINGARAFHDYAHHPTEIKSSIDVARSITSGKVICIFQPHTYSRTRDLFDGFVESLSYADKIILYPIYPAREDPILGITSDKLSEAIRNSGRDSIITKSFDDCYREINNCATNGDIVLVLGAGDIIKLCKYFKNS